MKINYNGSNQNKAASEQPQISNITELIDSLKEKHGEVGAIKIEDEVFFYRALKRGEYLKLCERKELSELEKEDIVCSVCTVYPEDYDFENCEAAIPSLLCKAILESSYLDSVDTRTKVLAYFREEMFDVQNQITCIINEAFPQFSLEEIEDWDMLKTAKYLSRAEWKLVNFRGATFNYDPSQLEQQEQPQAQPEQRQEEAPKQNLKGGKKEKMSSEKLAELQKMREKFPEINWDADAGLEGIDGIEKAETVDTASAALRPGF